jgi:Zn-finger nucleic acid-binding protein/DNA-directed RNA polymerase subunit RPC12/RpoP
MIACPACRRQYSVAERLVGKSFHCHCGEKVKIQPPRGHDASVVACSSCGAPRENQASACGHCHSDFTLHEQDLDTVCPQCLSRISRRGRYCHHCGVRIAPEEVRKRNSKYCCPVCPNQALAHRVLGEHQVAVLECQTCAGLWIPLAPFEALIDKVAVQGQVPHGPRPQERKLQTGPMYRPCVMCGDLMIRRNFGQGASRVVIDVCRGHGLWFDDEELAHILAYIRTGGLQAAREELARLQGERPASRAPDPVHIRPLLDGRPYPRSDEGWGEWPSLIGTVLEFIFLGLR